MKQILIIDHRKVLRESSGDKQNKKNIIFFVSELQHPIDPL